MDTKIAFELLKIQNEALRGEIMEKMKLSHQLGNYKLIAIGAILSIAITKGIDQKYNNSLFLTVMMLPVVFDSALFFNGNAMIKVGRYIKIYIEPNLRKCASMPEGFLLWEESIATDAHHTINRFWWNLFEAVQPVITIVLQLIVFRYLLAGGDVWLITIGSLAVVIEILLLVFAVRRK